LVDIDNVLNKNLFVFVGINGKFHLDMKKILFLEGVPTFCSGANNVHAR
jgi:hypothetical protein